MDRYDRPSAFWTVVLEYLGDFSVLLAAALLLFSFAVRSVVVSGDSMLQTLVDGDYLVMLEGDICLNYEQGDIVVAAMDRFRDGLPIVKRVIATEGQTVDIDFSTGTVYVDGAALHEPYIYTPTTRNLGMQFPLTVDEGCLFLMGDNRGVSDDSRDPMIGLVDRREILGKAIFLAIPGTDGGFRPRDFSRIGGLSR